jgi:hypothetical protein
MITPEEEDKIANRVIAFILISLGSLPFLWFIYFVLTFNGCGS